MEVALIIAALVFAWIHGLNTGASMLATSINMRGLGMFGAVAIMTLGVLIAPFLFGTEVAKTLAVDLTVWPASESQRGMLIAVCVTIAVIFTLSRLRIPSSLTLALVGAISGYGWALYGEVNWKKIGIVLGMMFIAPIIGGLIAAFFNKGIIPLLPRVRVSRFVQRSHLAAFFTLSTAYGANDAQKMIAVMAVAFSATSVNAFDIPWLIILGAVLFGLGSLIGVRQMAKVISSGVFAAGPTDMVVTELSTSLALAASTVAGSPVGLAQTMSGSLVGSGASLGYGRVRWRRVRNILIAWIVTLPAAVGIAAAAGKVVSHFD